MIAPSFGSGTSDLLFSGMVSRWLYRKGSRWVERFDIDLTGERAEPKLIGGAFDEQTLVDVFTFRDVAKLGPAIIYARALPAEEAGFDASEFFLGNLEIEKQLSPDWIDLSGESEMADGEFWEFISSIGQPESREAFDRLIERVASCGDEFIFGFHNALAHRLFSLDHPANAVTAGVDFAQREPGLCLRCAAVRAGNETFDSLLENPGSIGWAELMRSSEVLVNLASLAHGQLHGRMPPNLYTAWPIDTGSNASLWGKIIPSTQPTPDNFIPAVDVLATADELEAFYANYTLEHWGGAKDRVWDGAAAGGVQWMIARAIVRRGNENAEVLVWLASTPSEPDSIRTQRVVEFLTQSGGLVVPDSLIETVDTHSFRPFGSMPDMFRISRRSRLSLQEYSLKYVGFSSNRAPG